MAVENQTAEIFADNRHLLRFTIKDDAGAILDLTGKLVQFALALNSDSGPVLQDPLLDFKLGTSSQITVPTPTNGIAIVEILPGDTAALAPVTTVYYGECEVIDADGSNAVVTSTVLVTIKPNVENA